MINIIIAVIIILIVSIFSVQNATPVAISFILWHFQASIAIVIFLSVLSGIIIGATLTFLLRLKKQRKAKYASPGTLQDKAIDKKSDVR
jgi:uncharacterized integral membrane protein